MSLTPSRESVRSALRCLAFVACASFLSLSGCATRESADPARESGAKAEPASTFTWPERDVETLDHHIAMKPGKHRLYVAGLDDLRGKVRPFIWSGEVEVLCRRPEGLGVLCEVRRLDQQREWYDPRVFMFYSSQTPVMRADPTLANLPKGLGDLDGTPMDGVIYRLRPDARGVPATRGIVVALRPLSGATYIRPVINELRDRGWVVIESSLGFGIAGVGDERDASTDADLDRYGSHIGELANERLSEWAYGCEAMIRMVREERPELRDKPVVVAGFSAGAIGAPTVAARLGKQVRGVVLVGGGVNIARIAQTSTLSDFGLGVTYHGHRLSGDKLERFSEAYLRSATLDSYHTATALRRTPTLMLQAADDDIVPVDSGCALYEQLGHPERWVFGGGHELLFLELGFFDTKIADWIDGHVPSRAAEPARVITARPVDGLPVR
jgi:alpha-beta hydrolase superfamily lysophospholipase